MKKFSQLFEELDSTTSTNEKILALVRYFKNTGPEDSMWTVLLLTGRVSKKAVTARALRQLFVLHTGYPEWLFEECQAQVGDSAETLSLLARTMGICRSESQNLVGHTLTEWMEVKIPELAQLKDPLAQAKLLAEWWRELSQPEMFILNKLMTGAFRVGVSERLVVRALAQVYSIPTDQIAHRMTGLTSTQNRAFGELISTEVTSICFSQPYPFCLAQSWGEREATNFDPEDYTIEWKFDGIRSQVISRENQLWVWSRGEEDITAGFPDIVLKLRALPPGTVIDGEIVAMEKGEIKPFQHLQKRLGRKKVSSSFTESHPTGFIAYDCLEFAGIDLRSWPLIDRRKKLEEVLTPLLEENVLISTHLKVKNLDDLVALRQEAREKGTEGLMLKKKAAPYTVGRKAGNWWKYKVDPYTLDAVLLYAQAGSGRRANLYTDYTFALWGPNKLLVPFAKAYSGLDQKEIQELDVWIRYHTKEKFGPVRSVKPVQVFEIGFEGISKSGRHKSGIAVRFPRILRWRKDKPVEEADTLETAEKLL